MSDQADRRVGTVIGGKWRVDALLGAGSMAAVYAVTHRNGARAALKILHPNLCADPSVCERFLGEGYLTNSVKHPGIVRVLDDGATDDGCVFLVMDLLEGTTLEEARQQRGGRFDVPEILEIGDKLMDVLQAVHEAGIIHRDLKPQNVFVCHDGSVKLLDFGVARVFDDGAKSQLSVFGLVLGTPSFMSPEQALGARDQIDHRTDIWSLGATLFTAITGQTVHLGPNIQAKLLAAATAKARSISMARHDLPAPIANVIDVALRFKREDRWQSVEAFRHALRETSVELGILEPASLPSPGFPFGDESRNEVIDNGERALAMMVRTHTKAPQPPPLPNKRSTFPSFSDAEAPGAPPTTERLIRAAGSKSTIPRPPTAPPMRVRPRESCHPNDLPVPFLEVSDRPVQPAEGSFPAASSTLRQEIESSPRRSNLAMWMAGLFLLVVGVSSAAFYVLGPARDDAGSRQVTTAMPSLSSATAAMVDDASKKPAPTPAASFIVITDNTEVDAAPAPAPAPPRPQAVRPRASRASVTAAKPTATEPAAVTPEPPTPTPPPNPFGTPE